MKYELQTNKTRQVYNGPRVVKFTSTMRKKILVENNSFPQKIKQA